MHIPEDIVEQVRRESDIVDVIGSYLNLKKQGKNFVALSPFTNEKTPSFVVSPEKQIFKDFSSGKGGNVFSFLMEYNRVTFPEAVKILAEKMNIDIPQSGKSFKKEKEKISKRQKVIDLLKDVKDFYKRNLKLDEYGKAREYFLKRGFSSDVQEIFELGYSPDNWDATAEFLKKKGYDEKIMLESGVIGRSKIGSLYDRFKGRAIFPIKDHVGKVVGFGGRDISGKKDVAKYINSPQTIVYDKSEVIYGFYEGMDSIRNYEQAIVVEGYADVISLYQAGIKNTVAASGTALTEKHAQKLHRYVDDLYLNYDSDAAGQKAVNKAIDICLKYDIDVKIVTLPKDTDPDDIVKKQGKKGYEYFLNNAESFLEYKVNKFTEKENSDDPKKRSQFIRETIDTINCIADEFVHEHYLNKLADLLRLNERERELLFKEKRKVEVKKDKSEKKLNLIKKDEYSWQPDRMYADLKEHLDDSEIRIFEILLNSSNIKAAMEELSLTTESFTTPKAMQIYDHLENLEFNSRDELFEQLLNSEEAEEDLNDILTNILFLNEEYNPSEKWTSFRPIEGFDENEILKQSLKRIMLNNLEEEYEQMLEEIENNPDDNQLLSDLSQLIKKREQLINEED